MDGIVHQNCAVLLLRVTLFLHRMIYLGALIELQLKILSTELVLLILIYLCYAFINLY